MRQITIEAKCVKTVKEQPNRVETMTWNVSHGELTHFSQLYKLTTLLTSSVKDKYARLLLSHVNGKLHGYKRQDELKNKYNPDNFVESMGVVHLLCSSNLRCHYCDTMVYVLYEKVRQNVQWTLDRINNDIGHDKDNVVISCLQCNLKRRRTNKDAFMFSKNLIVKKLQL